MVTLSRSRALASLQPNRTSRDTDSSLKTRRATRPETPPARSRATSQARELPHVDPDSPKLRVSWMPSDTLTRVHL